MNSAYSHLLIIEDDPAVARSLQDGLRRNGFSVAWESRGGEGLEYARRNAPHLILLDVRLPDGSGFDFCRQMRQSGLRQLHLIRKMSGLLLSLPLGIIFLG